MMHIKLMRGKVTMTDIKKDIITQFNILAEVSPYGDGHINDTYVTNTSSPKFILQRINHVVFKNPEQVMENIVNVTEFLKKKIAENGGNPKRETLSVIYTKDKKSFVKTKQGNYFRMYEFIEGARTYQTVQEPIHFYNAAKAFGKFQNMLDDYPANTLFETIPDFHNTKKRFENFLKAVEADKFDRKKDVLKEIDFVLSRESMTALIVDAIEDGRIPLRVTHNDTKYNNLMIDDKTGEAICVIDLDTVMPGSLLYDYGDSLRFGTNPVEEDEKNLDLVYCDMNLFEMFTKGFLEEVGDKMTKTEIDYLPLSARMMTFECGMRFLTDYLEGDTYFRTHYPTQNLDRCRTQFKLVWDMEQKEEEMKKIIRKYI